MAGPLAAMLPIAKFLGPTLLSGAMGGKQLGEPAPAFNPGAMQDPFNLPKASPDPVGDVVSRLPQSSGANLLGSVGGLIPSGVEQDPFDLPGKAEDEPFKFKFDDFLGGIDKGLQSPAQLLGLGLLGQLGRGSALPLMGLLGMGLYNSRKDADG